MTLAAHPHASMHHRPFTAAMAAAAGISPTRLRAMVRGGEVRAILHGVYADAGLTDSVDLRAAAAALVLPPHAVVADRSAAWLLGVDVHDVVELDATPRLEVVSMDDQERSRRHGVYGGQRDLAPEDVTTVGGIRVTTPLRTACDIGRMRGRWRAIGGLDALRRRWSIPQHELTAMLPRFARRRGVIQLRELVPLSTDEAHSQPESWVRLELHDHGLPMPSPQVRIPLPDGGSYLVENAWEHLRIAVEYDGVEFHSEPRDRDHDDERRRVLSETLGWAIYPLRAADLSLQRRESWCREVAAKFADRAGLPRRRVWARGPDSYLWRPR